MMEQEQKIVDSFAPTWSMFTGPVTYIHTHTFMSTQTYFTYIKTENCLI